MTSWKRAAVAMALCSLAVAVAWGIVHAVMERRAKAALEEAKQDLGAGRIALARGRLAELVAGRPGWDEALYQLAVCEQARNRPAAALKILERIPRPSPWSGWSDVRRSRIEMDRGRFTESETLLRQAARAPGSHVAEARWGLVLLLRMEGRFEEAHRWLEDGFDVMTSPVETLQRLYRLDVDPFPIDGVRIALERAGRQAPADERVWLARAHLAILRGEFADAQRWLERCLSSRPEDPVVWRMNLECGLAAGRVDQVRQALGHLPAAIESKERLAALRVWLAERQGDRRRERLALEQAVELNPADALALERLAELERAEGRADLAARHRERIRAIERDRKQYIRLLASSSPETHAAELASCATRLGRRFDAARWAQLAAPARRDAGRATLPADSSASKATPAGVTLADLIDRATQPGDRARGATARNLVVGEFSDDASTAGLDFDHQNGGAPGKLIPPVTASGGVGLLDVDNDGWLDVYLVQGGSFPPDKNSSPSASGDRLYRNRGDGRFEDVTVRSGIKALAHGYGHGIAVGDIDNDGWSDVFVTRWRRYALYRNRGNGTFEDITENAGLAGDRDWPTSAVLADLDGDGDLDLYVCHYFKWNEIETRSCVDPEDRGRYRCLPLDFDALPDHVFRNDGGRFIDVTREAGIVDTDGRGLGVLAADLDGDGRTDLFVANDMTANFLFRNLGGFRFEEIALTAGVAGNASGTYQAGMGVACGDLDSDGRLDLAVTNFYNESTTFFQNLGQSFFADRTAAVGLAVPSRYVLGFGISFLDANNDGWLDLITANGHVHDGRPQFPWKMPVQLYLGIGNGRLVDSSARSGVPFQERRMGRGLACGDLDNDGRVDAVVISQNDPVAFFHNRTGANRGHFITLLLEGTKSNRDGVGATVSVKSGGRTKVAARLGGGSYQSASDPRMHFGLAESQTVDSVDVSWPSGQVSRFSSLRADTGYRLCEGDPVAHSLRGWNH